MRKFPGIERNRAAAFISIWVVVMLLFSAIPAADVVAEEPSPTSTSETEADENTASPTVTFTVTPEVTATGSNVPGEEPGFDEQDIDPGGPTTRILVTKSTNANLWKLAERMTGVGKVIEKDELSKLGVVVLEVPVENLQEKMNEIRNMTGVLYVEPDYPVQALDTIPNDPGFVNQYALTAIRAPQGWDLSTGSSSITIAILDSGVDLGHVDLVSKLVGGYDFINNDAVPNDDYGHGTHVAGIAGASANNGAGMSGVSWGARIMPVKVLNSLGGGSYAGVASGIVWAVDHGAQVINMSLGGAGNPDAVNNPSALKLAVQYAYNHNVLLVAAAGNTGSSIILYPARYPEVMAVGASNMSNQPANFTNYGPQMEIAAPGENIYSLWWPGSYSTQNGTSMSTPHVSGLAAILLGYISGADAVRGIIKSTALDIGPAGWDQFSGAGLIQMDAALALVVPPTETPVPSTTTAISPASGGGNLFPPSYFPGYGLQPSPTWTPSALPTLTPVSPTPTLSTLTDDLGEVQAQAESPTPTPTPLTENKVKRLKVFWSPYFCGAVLLIFLGVWLIWRSREYKKRSHNKFVM